MLKNDKNDDAGFVTVNSNPFLLTIVKQQHHLLNNSSI